MEPEQVPPPVQLMQMIAAKWVSKPIHVAAKLGVADHLRQGPRHVDELAREVGAHAPSLYRLLRGLASVGVFAEVGEKRFELTPLAALLASGPGSARPLAIMIGERWHDRAWEELLYSVQTGSSGF